MLRDVQEKSWDTLKLMLARAKRESQPARAHETLRVSIGGGYTMEVHGDHRGLWAS